MSEVFPPEVDSEVESGIKPEVEPKAKKKNSRKKRKVKLSPDHNDLAISKADEKEKNPFSEIKVNTEHLVYWLAKIKTGIGHRTNAQLLANKIAQECFKIDGKELTIQEASALINKKIA